MKTTAVQREIRAIIRFYEKRGWDWTDAVTFTGVRAAGLLEKVTRPGYRKMPHEYVRDRRKS